MSEYIVCDTEITDLEALKEALADIGVNPAHIEVHESPVALEGYQGDARQQKAHVVIRRYHVGSCSNDIGFERGADGRYKAWVSEFDQSRGLGHSIMKGTLLQHYAKRKILREVKGRFKLKSCEEKDGKVRIKVELS